ncbi:MAG: hypothetical protein LH606_18960 [Cytophagaceae bacterium]|nr:hypothetical protein [Cytophagaceae bacterium]
MGKIFCWFFLSLLGYSWLAYATARADFAPVLLLFFVLFSGYAWFLHHAGTREEQAIPASGMWKTGLVAAIAFRLVWLGALPALSDDYFRFIWDGRLLASGQNPYLILPTDHTDWLLFNQLNSPSYFTVYPPLHQACFALGAWLFPDSVFNHVLVLRLIILLAELGNIFLITRLLSYLKKPTQAVFLYALNPLVIVELTGNLHFEGVMTFFFLLAVWLLIVKKQWVWSAVSWGAAISIKLLPLLFLPLLVRRLGWGQGLSYFGLVLLVNGVLFAPFFSWSLVENLTSSLDLYVQKFEFNASFYYLVRAIGFWSAGSNIIQWAGPGLAAVAMALMLALIGWDYRRKSPDFGPRFWMLILLMHTLYLAFATTVHPWYVVPLVAYSVFTPWRYAIVWSGGAVLSYAAYANNSFTENSWLVALEYTAVYGWLAVEAVRVLRTKSPSKSTVLR